MMRNMVGWMLAAVRGAWRYKLVKLTLAVLVIWLLQYLVCNTLRTGGIRSYRCPDPQQDCTPK